MKYAMLILLFAPFVSASVVINQVLYDPVNTESGGEAVELKNAGDSSVDISGWVLATESSATDATVPESTILAPGAAFLIADVGWDENKDDASWRSADYEEKITLGNTDSGVALVVNGSVMDAVGWGDADGMDGTLYEGSPASMVSVGNALLRTKDTDDNSQDFVESAADFQPGIPVPMTINVSITTPVIEVSKSLNLAPEGILSIKNNGAEPVNIKLVFNDFHYKNYTIAKNAVDIDTSKEFTVQPAAEHKSKVSLRIPVGTVPGTYTSTLRVIISGS
jgi:hypothetical protein